MRGVVTCAATAALFLGYTGSAFAGAASQADRDAEAMRQQQIQELAEQPPEQPKTFWYVEAGPAYFDMDAVNGFGAAVGDSSDVFVRQTDDGLDISGLGVKGAVGFSTPIKNSKNRVLGQADIAWVKDNTNGSFTLGADEYVDILPIDGDVTPSFVAYGPAAPLPGSSAVTVTGNAKFYRVGGFMGVGRENQTDNRRTLIGAGVYGSYAKLGVNSRISADNPAFAVVLGKMALVFPAVTGSIDMNEKVKMGSAGPMVVGQVGFALSDRVDFTLGGRAAGLYSKGRLDAVQNATDILGVAYQYELEDKDTSFAYLGELKAGFDFKTSDRVTLSLFGSGEARNDYFAIKNPRSGPGINHGSAASYNPGAAQLDRTTQIIGSIGAAAKFAF